MPACGFRCALEFYNDDWRRLGRQAVAMDLEPAWECVRLDLLRRGRPAPADPVAGPGRIAPAGVVEAPGRIAPARVVGAPRRIAPGRLVPRWSAKLGPPYVEGFRIEVEGVDGEERMGVDFPNAYFKNTARRAAERYVDDGALCAQEGLRYLVMLFPAGEETNAAPSAFAARRHTVPLPLVESSLERHQAGALLSGVHDCADLPVFLPAALLREVKDRTRAAGAAECGGILLGHVHRDRSLPELFVDVTVQVAARHAQATADRLTFTPDTWRNVDAVRDRRADGEIMVGWWHSHPVGTWCQDSSPEERRACALAEGFLSAHDRHLQRTVFPGAHCVALVVTDPGDREPTCTLFGWRRGQLARRGYYVRPSPASGRRSRGDAGRQARTQPVGVRHGSVTAN